MTITEIINTIHEERVELEVFEILHKWMIEDRAQWTSRAMDSEATIRCVNKIAKGNESAKNATKGIIDVCDSAIEN